MKKPLSFNQQPLSSEVYCVLFENGTEAPFDNAYWNHWDNGLYVNPISGAVLFTSFEKFSCLCGWPAFYAPFDEQAVQIQADHSHNQIRQEVRTKADNLHLGHVFDDLDPDVLEQGYQRYCINSNALIFVDLVTIEKSTNQEWKKAWNKAYLKNISHVKRIVIAGGCFWGVQHLIRQIDGVYFTQVGYANATCEPMNYQTVCAGQTHATEAVEVLYHNQILPLNKLLRLVFEHVNPTTKNFQGNDVGSQYRSGIYYTDLNDKLVIDKFIQTELVPQYVQPIVTEVLVLENFTVAEECHQDYLVKNPNGYCHIKF